MHLHLSYIYALDVNSLLCQNSYIIIVYRFEFAVVAQSTRICPTIDDSSIVVYQNLCSKCSKSKALWIMAFTYGFYLKFCHQCNIFIKCQIIFENTKLKAT